MPSSHTSSKPEEKERLWACSRCGRPTTLRIADQPLCEQCYQEAGSCCTEFTPDDSDAGQSKTPDRG